MRMMAVATKSSSNVKPREPFIRLRPFDIKAAARTARTFCDVRRGTDSFLHSVVRPLSWPAMIRLVLFDIDGTLVHTGGAGVKAFAKVFATEFGATDGFA